IKERDIESEISGGIVLTGGGALIKGMPELGEYILMKPTKVGYPQPFGGMTNLMQNPKFSTVLGLLLESRKHRTHSPTQPEITNQSADLISRLSDSLKSVLKEIF